MFEFLTKVFDTTDFPPRWKCGQWTAGHGWLHILSDLAIFGAYAAIPVILVYFILRRKDIPFLPIFWLFAGFILFCGTGHLIEATIFWHPWYRLSGVVKFATALISWGTVIALFRVTPQVLTLPGLGRMNIELQKTVGQLKIVEQELLRTQSDLEERVRVRTANLEQANQALVAEVNVREKAERALQQRTEEMERFNREMVGRETRMIELKCEVNALAKQLGQPEPYDLSFLDPERGTP